MRGRQRPLSVAIAVVFLLTACGSVSSAATTRHYLDCALKARSFLPVSSFGPFFVDISRISSNSTWSGLRSATAKPPLWDTMFKRSRLVGAMSRRALQSPFIEQEQAFKAHTAHSATPWPLTPLRGLVVERTMGLLEVYQTHNVYSGRAGAYALAAELVATDGGLGGFASEKVAPPHLGEGRVAYEFLEVPANTTEERILLAGVVYGSVLAQFSFQGGRGVSSALVNRFLISAGARLAEVCGS